MLIIEVNGKIGDHSIRKKIFEITNKLFFCKEIVVGMSINNYEDQTGKPIYFLRIMGSKGIKMDQLFNELKLLKMYIIKVPTDEFIPTEK